MRFRQVHLDFHTSELIEGIGEKFSKEQFQKALKIGNVDSITVFSKCHHGWAYHPSVANEIHPHLKFDLLGEMIDAAHEIDVKTPVYLSAGLDEKLARRHTEWLVRDIDDKAAGPKSFMFPGYHRFCMNTPYLDILLNQVKEVLENYDADGIFLDIVGVTPCYCQNCVADILRSGKDPRNFEAVRELSEKVYENYTKRVRETIDSVKPGLSVFHNGGHITRGRRDLAYMNSHLELESLPTGGWGYDHFPLSARYSQGLGMEMLGMTGKFHESWGEFGGFKHPNALRYEAALSIANGAKCSIGDQLHPSGLMDEATYSLIAPAYKEVKEKEPWCKNVQAVADVALLSTEAVEPPAFSQGGINNTYAQSDVGAARMLLEAKYLFDVVDLESDFNKYKVLILPDCITINESLKNKLNDFIAKGGKILATGFSGLNKEKTNFNIDFGIRYDGENEYKPSYLRPNFKPKSLEESAFVMYSQGCKIALEGATQLGHCENSYFNRDAFSFSSHQHTPNDVSHAFPAMTKNETGIYVSWQIFNEYAEYGSLILKEMFIHAMDILLGENKTLTTSLPAQGVVTLMEQKERNRYVAHLLYASPVKRGKDVEIIEDIIPIYNVEVSIKIEKEIDKLYLAPQNEEIPFNKKDGRIFFNIPVLECHQIIAIEYKNDKI